MLFFLRGSSALPAPERVERVQDAIVEVAEASTSTDVTIAFEDNELGTSILADGVQVTIVTVADAELDQMELDVLSFLHGQAIEEAIIAYRANRTDQARVSGAIEAAGWTFGFIVFVVAILWLHRGIRRRTLKFVKRHLKDVETATAKSVQAEAIAALVRYGLNFILLIIFFLGFYYYLSFVLLSFAETRILRSTPADLPDGTGSADLSGHPQLHPELDHAGPDRVGHNVYYQGHAGFL